MPYININGQLTPVSQAEFDAYYVGNASSPAAGGTVTQLNNTQEILNPNTTIDIPGQALPVADQGVSNNPPLLTDEQINAIYPPIDPKETGATFGEMIITDSARKAYSDPASIAEQLRINEFAANNPPPTITTTSVPLSDAEAAALFAGVENSAVAPSNTTLTPAQSTANAAGTGALTAEQQLAQDQKTAADAAVLYPGSNNEALRQIDVGAGRIAANEVGIANAEKIIAVNDAELADPNISDARRVELQANNIAQQEYIQAATENSIIQENIIEQNANVYAAGGGNPGDGLAPPQVNAAEDPTIQIANADAQIDSTTPENVQLSEEELAALFANTEISAVESNAAESLDPLTDEQLAQQDAALQDQILTDLVAEQSPAAVDIAEDLSLEEQDAALLNQVQTSLVLDQSPADVDPETDPGVGGQVTAQGSEFGTDADFAAQQAAQEQGSRQAAMTQLAKDQATYQARYKQPANGDWRLRLSISPNAQYLYLANPPGILAPLAATEGVIFPYTPTITTSYSANYEQYDLTHSNYRGIFYKNSRVGDITVRGTFTAQDTTEANYLLAVIHFFRSVTKMFYGQDAQRGTPPPICFLNGFGQHQFSNHSCVVSSFNYTLPNDVDYIRANGPNNFGLNLANRANPIAAAPGSGGLAGLNRLLNAIPGGLPKGGLLGNGYGVGSQSAPAGTVQNTLPVSYVPTKMEVDITLIPVQTRSQVSKQFSLQGFARGDLLRGGFW